VAHGAETDPERCAEIAATLNLLTSDVLTIAGHPVPAALLPPQRDARVMKRFVPYAAHCNHAQMATLTDFIHTLPTAPPDLSPTACPGRKVYADPQAGHFAPILDGLMRNRGFGPGELPFIGLSLSTIYNSMLTHDRRDEHRWFQLSNTAGPLG
jgi:hypothetical protein